MTFLKSEVLSCSSESCSCKAEVSVGKCKGENEGREADISHCLLLRISLTFSHKLNSVSTPIVMIIVKIIIIITTTIIQPAR